jgi:hypothetical protein
MSQSNSALRLPTDVPQRLTAADRHATALVRHLEQLILKDPDNMITWTQTADLARRVRGVIVSEIVGRKVGGQR